MRAWGHAGEAVGFGKHLGCKVKAWSPVGEAYGVMVVPNLRFWNTFGLQSEVLGACGRGFWCLGAPNWRLLGCKMTSWGPVGKTFEGHGAQEAHIGSPNGKNLKNLRFWRFQEGPRSKSTCRSYGNHLVLGPTNQHTNQPAEHYARHGDMVIW